MKNHKLFGAIACSTKGKTLTLTLTNAPMSYETGTWPLSIRSGRVYAKATVAIEQFVCQKDFFNEYGKNGSQFAGRSSYELTGIYQVSALVYTQILTT